MPQMSSFVDWIANKLEDIDKQAGETSMTDVRTQERDEEDPALPGLEISALRSNLLRSNKQVASLEEQLSSLERMNSHLEMELRASSDRVNDLVQNNEKLEIANEKAKKSFASLDRKQGENAASFERAKQGFDDMRGKLEKEVLALSQQLSITQGKLSESESDVLKLADSASLRDEEIAAMESEITRYRENAVKSLRIGDSSDVSAQLEVVENERARLKEKLAKCEQRVMQAEAGAAELREQTRNDLLDTRQQKLVLQSELARAKTQHEAATHEIALVKAQLAAAQEDVEARCRMTVAAEKSRHATEVTRLREQFSANARSGKSAEEQLLNAMAMVESLRGEKAALMMRLESQRTNEAIGGEAVQPKVRFVSLAARVPTGTPIALVRGIVQVEMQGRKVVGFMGRKPVVRSVLIMVIVLMHLIMFFRKK